MPTFSYWSIEDQVFVAEAPELPGCTAHGQTEEFALKTSKMPPGYISIQLESLATQRQSPGASFHVCMNGLIGPEPYIPADDR